ncbi:MAG: guanitoxin biosynthesis heme-dependent pre-guanitoxin N-hydroxylase GntA [Vulcanimicrobiaceae bacterium]
MDTAATTRLDFLQRAWDSNPFDSDLARANSTYSGFDRGSLVRLLETAKPGLFERIAHASFREFVLDDAFSCLGAKAALRSGTYRFGTYDALDDAASTAGLARDLYAFASERQGFEGLFTTYIAVFAGFERTDDPDLAFESALWRQLGRLHDLDRNLHAWDPHVSNDPDDPNFSYSFAGTGFFIVGLHPESTRAARRFAWPTLVFNAHEQFETLKERGQFERLQDRIRARELVLDGSLNPNLSDYGEHSEARQYAGRPLPEGWTCPFRP